MSGTDRVNYNSLERALSSDQNNMGAIKDRVLLNALREQFSLRSMVLGSAPQDSPRDVVLGGFDVTPTGTSVSVGAGVLAQEAPALLPALGPYDSSYRFAQNTAPVVLAMPSPGSDSWVLIEAAMQEVVTSTQMRDIWDDMTQTFSQMPVPKIVEYQAQLFQTTAVGSIPARTANRVPIAAVFRASGGGTVLPAHLVDLRPLAGDNPRSGFAYTLASGFAQVGRTAIRAISDRDGNSNLISISAHAFLQNGREVWYHSNGAIVDLSAARYNAGYTSVGSVWRYLYLCAWRGVSLPGNGDPTTALSRGIFVISDVAPASRGGLTNGSTLTLPAPWSHTVPAGEAVCVGAVMRSVAGDGWVPMWSVDGRYRLGRGLGPNTIVIATPTGTDTVDLSSVVPVCARSATLRFTLTGGAVTTILAQSTTGTGVYTYDGSVSSATGDGVQLEVPLVPGTPSFVLRTIGTAPSSILVHVVGFSM